MKITGAARAGLTPTGMTPLSEWQSPPVAAIVRLMNQPSDNYIAEMLIKGLGAQFGEAGSTSAGGAVIREALRPFGISPHGRRRLGPLPRGPHDPARGRAAAQGMDESEAGVAFDASLAVIGRNGTLYNRMRGTAAQDRCHAKTGTLRDVSALAGFCTTTGGERVAFAFLMNRVYPAGARSAAGPHDGSAGALRRIAPAPGNTALSRHRFARLSTLRSCFTSAFSYSGARTG